MLDDVARSILNAKESKDQTEVHDPEYPEQDSFVKSEASRISALCTRRAGKTNGLALRFIRTMRKHPGQTCRYIALTRDSAQDIMWPVLEEVNERFGLGGRFHISRLEMELPNGSKLRLYGADMKNFVRRLKGVKSPAVAIDEAQDFGDHLENLIEAVIEPTLADFADSWLAITGTPGPIPRGYFFDITEGKKLGAYDIHKWSLFSNPYLPDPRGYVEGLKRKYHWDERHPTLQREYYGKWVLDVSALLIRYSQEKNHFEELAPLGWHYLLGVDIGFKDADALAVIAWHESTPNIYLVDEEITAGQDVTALAQGIQKKIDKYKPSKIVVDYGGLGKKIIEELRRRFQLPVHEADKKRKWENIALLNDYLNQGKFFARKDSRFAQDSYRVQVDYEKSTPDRLVEKSGFHSDVIPAVLYAFKESQAYTFRPEPPKPKYGSKEWQEAEVDKMEQAAIEYFENQGTENFGLLSDDEVL